jgi:hypothetical protein
VSWFLALRKPILGLLYVEFPWNNHSLNAYHTTRTTGSDIAPNIKCAESIRLSQRGSNFRPQIYAERCLQDLALTKPLVAHLEIQRTSNKLVQCCCIPAKSRYLTASYIISDLASQVNQTNLLMIGPEKSCAQVNSRMS